MKTGMERFEILAKYSSIFVMVVLLALLVGWQLPFTSGITVAVALSLAFLMLLYWKQFELFIVIVLVANQEFFYLLPRDPIGEGSYQDFLYYVIPLTGVWYFLRNRESGSFNFNFFIWSFFIITLGGVLNSYAQGQPLILGLKAAKGYYLIAFYFVFMSRKIDLDKLMKYIVITGLALSVLNNYQYFMFGNTQIFYYDTELMREGRLRFLIGDFFTIFSPLIAFGEFLRTNKKRYLAAALYMGATVILQGLTRSVITGLVATIIIILLLTQKIDLKKFIIIGLLVIAGYLFVLPILERSVIGDLYNLTAYEIVEREGNVGLRMKTYEYYIEEYMISPLFGRGIWNDSFRHNNPEDMKMMGFHLSDIGSMSILFHFGLVGVAWCVALVVVVFRRVFTSTLKISNSVHPGLVSYFIFSLFTVTVLNGFLQRRTIIYLALTLALLSQAITFGKKKEQHLIY